MAKRKLSKEMLLLIVFAAVFVLLSVMSPGKFLTTANLRSMCFQIPEFGLFAIAMMVTILTGGINLSVVTSGTLGSILAALVLSHATANGMSAGVAIALAMLTNLAISALCGLLNGWVISYIGAAAMLTTLGTSTLFEGLGLLISKGSSISGFPTEFFWIGNGTVLGIPVPTLIFLILTVVTWLLLEKTAWGAGIYIVGCNPKAADFSGIDVRRVTMLGYVYSGFLSGVATIIMMSRYNSARIDYGESYLMQTVAAAVLGGTLISGGYGRVGGVVVAVATLQCVSSGLNIFGLDTSLTTMITGLILIGVLTANFIAANRNGTLDMKKLVSLFAGGQRSQKEYTTKKER